MNATRKLQRLMEFHKDFSDPSKILIYQMGKVGSTSVEHGLEGSIHIHTMFGNGPCYVRLNQKRNSFLKSLEGKIADYVKRRAVRSRDKAKIITLVREPFSRDVSMFFQDLSHWFYEYNSKYDYDTRIEGLKILFDVFEKSYDHDYSLRWFDKEIRRLTGINVYEFPFDKDEGSIIITKDNFELLVLKYEKSDRWKDAVSEFCERDISFTNTNRSDQKWYSSVYKEFKKVYRPNEEYLHKLYSSKYVRHFYNSDEIRGFLDKYRVRVK